MNIDIKKSTKEEKLFLINECQQSLLHNEQALQNNTNLFYVITGVNIGAIAICASLGTIFAEYLGVIIGFIQLWKLNKFLKSQNQIKKKQKNILKQKTNLMKITFKIK